MYKFLIALSLVLFSSGAFAGVVRVCHDEQVYSPQYGGWITASVCREEYAPDPQQPTIVYSYAPPPQVIIVERRPEPAEYIVPFAAGVIFGGAIFHDHRHNGHHRR